MTARLQPISFQSDQLRNLTLSEISIISRLTPDWDTFVYNNFRYISTVDIVLQYTPPGREDPVQFTIPQGFLSDGFSSPYHWGEVSLVTTPLEWYAHDYLFATHALTEEVGVSMYEANGVFTSTLVRSTLNTVPQAATAWRKSFARGALFLKFQPESRTYGLWRQDWSLRPVTTVLTGTVNA